MEKEDRDDFLNALREYNLKEDDFEIKETQKDANTDGIYSLSVEITIKYKPSGIYKKYERYSAFGSDIFEDLKSNFYKTRQ